MRHSVFERGSGSKRPISPAERPSATPFRSGQRPPPARPPSSCGASEPWHRAMIASPCCWVTRSRSRQFLRVPRGTPDRLPHRRRSAFADQQALDLGAEHQCDDDQQPADADAAAGIVEVDCRSPWPRAPLPARWRDRQPPRCLGEHDRSSPPASRETSARGCGRHCGRWLSVAARRAYEMPSGNRRGCEYGDRDPGRLNSVCSRSFG